jgi:hypothetical protein
MEIIMALQMRFEFCNVLFLLKVGHLDRLAKSLFLFDLQFWEVPQMAPMRGIWVREN